MVNLIDLLRQNLCRFKYDREFDSNWVDEELLFHVIELDCYGKSLTNLPELPNCKILDCSWNKLKNLPKLSQCEYLNCNTNQLINLPKLSQCKYLNCHTN